MAEQQAHIPAVLAKGAGRLWVCGRGLQQPQTGQGAETSIRRQCSSRPLRRPGTHDGLQHAETHRAGRPTQRKSHGGWENAALAPAHKKAEHEKRTIICVEEEGVPLLPMIVRTDAPRGHPRSCASR
jgi:hypothetical protein